MPSLRRARRVCQRERLIQRKVEPRNEEKKVLDGLIEHVYSALLKSKYLEHFQKINL